MAHIALIRIRTIGLATCLGLLLAIGGTTVSAPAGTAAASPSESVVTGGTAEDAQMAEWALKQFEYAGLDLPPVSIEFAGPSLDPCGGAQARAYLDYEPVLVRVCWGSEFIVLHELAHVWEAGRLGSEAEATFMRLRVGNDGGALHTWADPALPWASQGREHAANVIAWGVMDEPTVVGGTYPNDRESLVKAYTVLTGLSPMHTEGGEPILADRSAFAAGRSTEPVSGR